MGETHDRPDVRTPATDARHEHGPFDVIGDVHGCREELEMLLGRLGYELERDALGRPAGAVHPTGRRIVFLGDLVDRGPDSPGVLRLVMGMVAGGRALCTTGNHDDKLRRYLLGRKVQVKGPLESTITQLAAEPVAFRDQVLAFLEGLPTHLVLDGGNLVTAHAGLPERHHNRPSGRERALALYGPTSGRFDEYGLPERLPWAQEYQGAATVLYGHTPTATPEWVNNTLCLDTGCAFGGWLSALRWPERELVQVPARAVWAPSRRPFPVNPGLRPADSSMG